MTNQVTYSIDLTPENADKIEAVNHILLTGTYKVHAATESDTTENTTEKAGPSLDDVKGAAKKAKSNHGEDFANSVLDSFDVKEASTLGRRMSAIDECDYQAIIDAWANGPQVTEQASDEPEDDLEDDLDDTVEDESHVTAEAVKTALKAYAKEVGRNEAKEIMQKHGANALSKVDACTPEQLKAMFAELV